MTKMWYPLTLTPPHKFPPRVQELSVHTIVSKSWSIKRVNRTSIPKIEEIDFDLSKKIWLAKSSWCGHEIVICYTKFSWWHNLITKTLHVRYHINYFHLWRHMVQLIHSCNIQNEWMRWPSHPNLHVWQIKQSLLSCISIPMFHMGSIQPTYGKFHTSKALEMFNLLHL